MARCIRSGNRYKRHQYRNGICRKCGAKQAERLKELAQKRAKRMAEKRGEVGNPTGEPGGNSHDRRKVIRSERAGLVISLGVNP